MGMEILIKHWIKVKFVLVGVWNTIFGYLVYIALDIVFDRLFSKRYAAYMSAAILSNILSITNAFIFHKYVTFKSNVKGFGIIIEYIRFTSTSLSIFFLGLLILPIFVEILHIDPKISGALVIPITIIVSYFGHAKFSFKNSVK
jgi:putative flippase GtrA